MRRLLIADSNEDFCRWASQALKDRFQIQCCASGYTALELLRRDAPDLLILDMMLPELDGLSVLEQARAEGISLCVLVVTSYVTDYVLQSAQELGIRYILRKPCGREALVTRSLDLGCGIRAPVKKPDPEHLAADYLLNLGFKPNHDGFRYLLIALPRMAACPELQITKVLYPEIAKQLGKVPRHIESSIRRAIESAWKEGNRELWQQLFPGLTHRPSNAVFLAKIAALIRRELE